MTGPRDRACPNGEGLRRWSEGFACGERRRGRVWVDSVQRTGLLAPRREGPLRAADRIPQGGDRIELRQGPVPRQARALEVPDRVRRVARARAQRPAAPRGRARDPYGPR